jgi:hypothetical protein
MTFLCGGMPLVGFAIGIWWFRSFGLTSDEHARVLAAIAERRRASSAQRDAEGSR